MKMVEKGEMTGGGEKKIDKDIISAIIFILVYMLIVNVKPYQKSAVFSCVIKPIL